MEQRFDPDNMFKSIWEFPENLKDAFELGNSINLKNKYKNINNIVVAGMGGSAIGGDVLSVLEFDNLDIPLIVCRGYSLPNWVDKNTLVICSSYSGNTEETLSALDDAIIKKAQICAITTGGKIEQKITELGYDIVIIPSGLQPRAALAFSFIPMTKLLQKIGLINPGINKWLDNAIETLTKNRNLYSFEGVKNPIYVLSQKIFNKIPIIYADNSTLSIAAIRLKGQICENAKMLAYHNELPELNHNEIVGWENNSKLHKDLHVLWLKDILDNDRVKLRQEITATILTEEEVDQSEISVEGENFQERFLFMINYGDWLSFWCAILHGTDPSPVVKISRLKEVLSKKI